MRLSHWAALIPAAALSLLASLASAADVTQVPEGLVTPQPAPVAPARPRIGLVLGGGGAKGGAHIGVIKVLEEMRIPVDCIAGTSMGSIVGAAYATGASADELEKIVTSINWRDMLSNVPRESQPYHRKALDALFPNGIEVGIRDKGIVAPGGLLPTHQIEALFRRIVADAGGVSDFNKLPIPFRAVSTDLESGAVQVWDRGDLAQAMRASMAVPGVFAPVEANGHLYVDGMLVRNLPVDVARQTCADVVIVVPVSNPRPPRSCLNSLLGVAGQSMNIAIEANERAQLATLTDKDIEISVVLKDISSGDFDKMPEAIPIGEAAARAAAPQLARYSVSPQAYAAWRAGLPRINGIGSGVRIDEVRLAGFKVTNPEVMKTYLHVKAGDTYDARAAAADTDRLVARGDFVAVDYRLEVIDGSQRPHLHRDREAVGTELPAGRSEPLHRLPRPDRLGRACGCREPLAELPRRGAADLAAGWRAELSGHDLLPAAGEDPDLLRLPVVAPRAAAAVRLHQRRADPGTGRAAHPGSPGCGHGLRQLGGTARGT